MSGLMTHAIAMVMADCPFYRDEKNQPIKCKGANCFVGWRWFDYTDVEIQFGRGEEPPDGAGWNLRRKLGPTHPNRKTIWGRPWGGNRRGYCGPCGKPELPKSIEPPAHEIKGKADED